jgi:hypothetical protein
MAFGFECGSGWEPILRRLFSRLTPGCVLHQVKEKFGGLRVYIGGVKDSDFDACDEAERDSFRTCELCGKPGAVNEQGYWLSVRCPDCRAAEEAARKAQMSKLGGNNATS